jgi:SRSO17 transposase
MDVHASPAALPELEEFLASLQAQLCRPEGERALERYLTGLLTEWPNKNCDTMAQAVPGTSEQRLQELLTKMQWDHDDLNRQRVEKLSAETPLGKGALNVDDTGFVKQGTASVGAARQYSGTLGKMGTCQVAGTCCYSDVRARWPVLVRLYLPKQWTDDPARWRRARVPEAITCATKPAIALALIDQARQWGVPYRYGVADADDGDHPNFLAGLEARRERYVVAVRRDCEVCLKRHGTPPSSARSGCWRPCPGASGAPSAGARGARAGGVKSFWRCVGGA